MARYALLPTPGDPAVVTFWRHFYDTFWRSLFDRLLVYYNPPPELSRYRDYVLALFGDATVIDAGGPAGHGSGLRRMVEHPDVEPDDVVAFFEDDGIVFKPIQLSYCLSLLDNRVADLVGSPRGSASPGLIEAETRHFGECHAGEDSGPNFWPNLFMARKALLQKTDMQFSARGWKPGEFIPPLGWTPGQEQAGDTLVWVSIQLRRLVPPEWIHLIPQWHSSPYDLEYAKKGRGIWSAECEWFHVGSLSSIPFGRDLAGVKLNTPAERLEWERRLMYVWLCSEESAKWQGGFEWANDYLDWVTHAARSLSLNVERMRLWMYAYRMRLGLT